MDDEALWRRRLLGYTAVRFGGLAIFFLGIAIIYTNLFARGGSPRVGAIVAILGALDALLAPRLLKKHWEQQDQERR